MKTLLIVITMLFISFGAMAKNLTIGLDLSGSNPLLQSEEFVERVCIEVKKIILPLKNGDVVYVKSFGAMEAKENLRVTPMHIHRRQRTAQVGDAVCNYLKTLPTMQGVAQSSTNILAWLEFSSTLDCANEGVVLGITDGIESSTVIDGSDLLSGAKTLPAPDVDLQGCNVTFYGMGAGRQYAEIKNLSKAWTSWFKKAGASFTAIKD